jgi:superoxide dismutase
VPAIALGAWLSAVAQGHGARGAGRVEDIRSAVRHHAGGTTNHMILLQSKGGSGSELATAVARDFGSFAKM